MFEEEQGVEWATSQMHKAKVPDEFQQVIKKLLDSYWSHPTADTADPKDLAKTLNTFVELAQGHLLVPDETEGTWVDAKPGTIVIRDTIRVKADAYTGEAGIAHNGRVGTVTAMRYGDIHVRYTDGKEPSFKEVPSVRHSPHALEKKVS